MSQHLTNLFVYCKTIKKGLKFHTVQYSTFRMYRPQLQLTNFPKIPSTATIDELSENTVSSATIDDPPDYTCDYNKDKKYDKNRSRSPSHNKMIGMADMIVPDT